MPATPTRSAIPYSLIATLQVHEPVLYSLSAHEVASIGPAIGRELLGNVALDDMERCCTP